MPSMVPIDLPLASTPSIRHEHTSRPSTVTLQAPQSPVAQPSLVPVRPELVAQHVEQRLLRLAQELDGIAVDGRRDVMFRHQPFLARSSAICAARRASTPATLMRYSLVPRLSSIGWQAARAAASSFCSAASSTLVPISAGGSRRHQQRARCHGAERHARGGAHALGVEREADAAADHGDVHLGARDEAQIGVARARGLGRQQERGDDLALGQRQLARAPA